METRLTEKLGKFELGIRVYEGDDGEFKLDCLEVVFDDWEGRKILLLRVWQPEEFAQLLDELKAKGTELERRARQIRDLLAGADVFYVEDF